MTQNTTVPNWRRLILSRLEEERPVTLNTRTERVRWLATHLDEYVDRWIGFAEHPVIAAGPASQAFDSDQFAIIELAIDLIGQEMPEQGLDRPGAARWDKLVRAHQELQASRDLTRRNELRTASGDFLAHLNSI